MKQVLRESLWLLAGGQYLSLLDEREPTTEVGWSYQDFGALRPQFSASSWRGAMLKATEQQWVQRRQISGRARFYLTRNGKQEIAADFGGLRQFIGSRGSMTLLVVRSPKKVTPTKAAQLRTLLAELSGVLLVPNVWIFPVSAMPDYGLQQIRRLGYVPLSLKIQPGTGQVSLGLSEWLGQSVSEDLQTGHQLLEEVVTRLETLLDKLKDEKKWHHLQISQLGSFVTRLLSELCKNPWLLLEQEEYLARVQRALELCDQAMVEWFSAQEIT